MVNLLLSAVTQKLHGEFGNTFHYYVEDVEQNLQKPCFTCDTISPLERSVNAKQYYRTTPCVIHYFTNNSTTPKHDCNAVAERALEALEYLTVGTVVVRGEDLSYNIVDDVLEIFVTYRYWTEKILPADDSMESESFNGSTTN